MPTKLLECIICPSTPSFSDASHLLTHVGSKAHLSYLHKAKIQSYQDTAAAHKLTVYDQWSQEHGIEEMLAERLISKECKGAAYRRGSYRQSNIVKQESDSTDQSSAQHAPNDNELEASAEACKLVWYEDHHLPLCTPVRRSSHPGSQLLASSPYRTWINESEDELLPNIDPQLKISPEASRLKGVKWPGMSLFDAADEETRRKRNQKKDGSVLKRIEHASTVVRPYEKVHSAIGHVLKERHMDELETDSLVEGESALMRQSPKRKAYEQSQKSKKVDKKKRRAENKKPRSPSRKKKHVTNSSTSSTTIVDSAYKPEVWKGSDITLPSEAAEDHKPTDTLAAAENYQHGLDGSVHCSILPNLLFDASSSSYSVTMSQLEHTSSSWLRPQNDLSLHSNPLKSCISLPLPTSAPDLTEPSKHKSPVAEAIPSSRHSGSINPLLYTPDSENTIFPTFASVSDYIASPRWTYYAPFGGHLEESPLSGRNPFSEAMAQHSPETTHVNKTAKLRETDSELKQ